MEKIKHLVKKYPKNSNRQRRISKNKVNDSTDSTKRTKIESLIDIEELKKYLLKKYSNNINDETIIIKDDNTVDLQFSYKDVENISERKCLEETKFFSGQINVILETCKHEHNLAALHQLQQSCIRMVGKMRKY